ncbi:leucyl/phenylalanyl-tRNA--protein transferase [Candidatus Gracilibacteria bacterium]|nr:leucyl/phenylalanyl-tRNA--protein transferase [Candidatus Gracilibacteria bacterium]
MMQLTPDLLISAYAQGIFPMADEFGAINFYDPNPRAIFPLDSFYVPRRLARTVRSGRFTIRVDSAFRAVMLACAEPGPGRASTWISDSIVAAYEELHEQGFAHSVEAWREGVLVGGLYGVALRGLFAGESMFSRERDASKVALVHLVERLRAGGYVLLDTQFLGSDHFRQFGVVEIPRSEYKRRLAAALRVDASFS